MANKKSIKGCAGPGRYSGRFVLRIDPATTRNIQVIRKHLWAAHGLQYLPSNSEAIRWAVKTASEFVERALFRDSVEEELRLLTVSVSNPKLLGANYASEEFKKDEISGKPLPPGVEIPGKESEKFE